VELDDSRDKLVSSRNEVCESKDTALPTRGASSNLLEYHGPRYSHMLARHSPYTPVAAREGNHLGLAHRSSNTPQSRGSSQTVSVRGDSPLGEICYPFTLGARCLLWQVVVSIGMVRLRVHMCRGPFVCAPRALTRLQAAAT